MVFIPYLFSDVIRQRRFDWLVPSRLSCYDWHGVDREWNVRANHISGGGMIRNIGGVNSAALLAHLAASKAGEFIYLLIKFVYFW